MTEQYRCAQCGAELAADAPEGLCPGCLLKRGLESQTGVTGATAGKGDSPRPSFARCPPGRPSGCFAQMGTVPFSEADYLPPTPAELAPYFPDLEILELVGRGGMGVVYKARQKRLDRLVALKILSPKIGREPAFAERFQREAQAMALLNHPHIVVVHDFGQTSAVAQASSLLAASGEPGRSSSPLPPGENDRDNKSPLPPGEGQGEGGESLPPVPPSLASHPLYYFLMEFVDGVNLRRLLDTGKLAPEEALAIVPQICDALQYAHDHGVVHRDIKPENILLDKQGQVKIADFGLAKLMGREAVAGVKRTDESAPAATEGAGAFHAPYAPLTAAGQLMGTPQYMAPEQFEHPKDVDHRADIYSLGVVFYQMLTGELPIGRFAPPSQKVQIDVRLDEVVLRALEKEPERRYQQASELKTQVETIATMPAVSSATGSASTSRSGTPVPDNGVPQTDDVRHGVPDLRASDFASGISARKITSHLTAHEKAAAMKFGAWFGMWNAATLFSPLAIVFWMPIPVPLNWIIASVVLFTGLAFYPLWWKKHARFLCSTKWAKERGIEPAAVRMVPFGTTGLILLGAALLLVLGALWWSVYEPAGVWFPALVESSISKQAGDISLRVTDVSQHKQIVLVRIVCERLPDSDKLFAALSAPAYELPDAIASETKHVDCLISPDPTRGLGKVLAGKNPFNGKSAFQIGYVLPDEQAAARAVELVRKFYLGQSRGLTKEDSVLPLFALHRRLGEDANGKPVVEMIHGNIGWQHVTASGNISRMTPRAPFYVPSGSASNQSPFVQWIIAWKWLPFAVFVALFALCGVIPLFFRSRTSSSDVAEGTLHAPYAAADDAAIEQARLQVQGPAIGLLVTGILNWVLSVPLLLIILPVAAKYSPPSIGGIQLNTWASAAPPLIIVPILAILILSSLVIFAALKMKRLQAYGLAIAASILAIIVSPSNLIGLPIGIWALVVLSQREVRGAFERKNRPAVSGLQRTLGITALVLCLVSPPIFILFCCSVPYGSLSANFMFLLPTLEAIALILGILGRKSFAGKFTVVLISIIFLVLGPFLWLRWMSQVHHDFGGVPSVVRLPQAVYGPVIERTVETDIHGKYAIDLDTGVLHTPPANLRNEQELNHWIRAVGADAVGVLGNGLSGRDMLLCTVQNARWDEDRPPVDMLDWFSRTMPSSPGTEISAEMPGKGPLPVTYQFKTREGGMGLLQIVGFSENPLGVKIRYKLVQTQTPASTHVGQALPDIAPSKADSRTKTGEAKPIERQPGEAERDRGAFEVRLPSGVTVELYGVSENPSKDQFWWRPDGSPVEKRPYETLGKAPNQQNDITREFAILFNRLPPEPVSTQVEFEPHYHGRSETQPKCLLNEVADLSDKAPGSRIFVTVRRELRAIALSWPADTKTATVRVGVAAGKWRAVCESAEPGAVYVGASAITFSKPEEKDGNLTVTVTSDIVGPELRVVAVGPSGQDHYASKFDELGAGKFRTINATFANLSLRDVKAFRLETRPYEWVEFRNVSLQAGLKTDVQVETPATSTLPAPTTRTDDRQSGGAGGFSAVIERVVNDWRESPADSAIDLDSGKLFSIPKELVPKPGEEPASKKPAAEKWTRDNGVECHATPCALFGTVSSRMFCHSRDKRATLAAGNVPGAYATWQYNSASRPAPSASDATRDAMRRVNSWGVCSG